METATLEDQLAILASVMAEIKPAHYKGQRPPQKSYEPATRELELLAFRWASALFGNAEMYFKFSIGGAGDGRRLWIYSLHSSGDEHGG